MLKVIALLSVQQVNIREINDNTAKFITVKETSKSKKNKLNHQQDYRIPLKNSIGTLPIEECQDKPEPTDEDSSMLPSFDHAPSKRRQKKQSTRHHRQTEACVTNDQYDKPLEQRKAHILPGRRTNLETTKYGKKICVIGDSHLNRIKKNIFQKSTLIGGDIF